MKPCILTGIVLALALSGSSAQTPKARSVAAYIAGVELIAGDKSLSVDEAAARYRRLCAITGVNGPRAKSFILRYRDDPAGWQEFEAMVTDVMQKKGS